MTTGEPQRRRKTRAQAQAETRQRLLKAAATTFARKGYVGASLDEIADAAGYSVGAVYSNFSSKEQVFCELMSEHAADRVETVADALRCARDQPPGGSLGELGRLLIDAADKNIEVAVLQTEFWLHAIRNPDTMEILAAGTRGTLDLLRDVVTELLEDHHVDQSIVSPETFAVSVLALYQGLTRQRRTDPSRVSEELFGQVLSWQLAGMPKLPNS